MTSGPPSATASSRPSGLKATSVSRLRPSSRSTRVPASTGRVVRSPTSQRKAPWVPVVASQRPSGLKERLPAVDRGLRRVWSRANEPVSRSSMRSSIPDGQDPSRAEGQRPGLLGGVEGADLSPRPRVPERHPVHGLVPVAGGVVAGVGQQAAVRAEGDVVVVVEEVDGGRAGSQLGQLAAFGQVPHHQHLLLVVALPSRLAQPPDGLALLDQPAAVGADLHAEVGRRQLLGRPAQLCRRACGWRRRRGR